MNFTRDPIIETIITPKEGYKLVIRNSKGGGHEEFVVDAIEVISYGHSFFFRSLERPKAFLVPTSDYEVIEVRDTRIALKTPSMEKSVKIGGGKEASLGKEEGGEEEDTAKVVKKTERRRQRRKRVAEDRKEPKKVPPKKEDKQPESKGGGAEDETKVSSGKGPLLPPPSGLISEKYRFEKMEEIPQGDLFSSEVVEEEIMPSAEEPLPLGTESSLEARPLSEQDLDLDSKIKPIQAEEEPLPDLFETKTEDEEPLSVPTINEKKDPEEDEEPVF